ncbi:hypothetical protein DAI22_09g100200 [Oryza sativa Japonica Group]|nr:hypothetical protein DAI22_09g100200 [Oryza sativa Japonica Group]
MFFLIIFGSFPLLFISSARSRSHTRSSELLQDEPMETRWQIPARRYFLSVLPSPELVIAARSCAAAFTKARRQHCRLRQHTPQPLELSPQVLPHPCAGELELRFPQLPRLPPPPCASKPELRLPAVSPSIVAFDRARHSHSEPLLPRSPPPPAHAEHRRPPYTKRGEMRDPLCAAVTRARHSRSELRRRLHQSMPPALQPPSAHTTAAGGSLISFPDEARAGELEPMR